MHSQKPQLVEFVNVARSLIGVPWRHRGCSAREVDCIGLVVYSAKQVGLLPADFPLPIYSTAPQPELMLTELRKIAVPVKEPVVGNVVYFMRAKNLVHLAILSKPRAIIHADRKHGAVSEVPFTRPWSHFPYTFWEFK